MLVLGTWPKRNKCIYDSVIPPFLHTFVVIKYLYKYLLSFCRKRQEKLLNVLLIFHTLLQCNAHSCFRGSVNCGFPSMENSFQVAKFLVKVQEASSLFCLVQNGPVVIWVACFGLRDSAKWSLRSARAFSEAFWTMSQNWDTQSQQAASMQFQKNSWNMNIYTKIYHKSHNDPHGPLIFMIFIF